jgi:ribosomal protein L11
MLGPAADHPTARAGSEQQKAIIDLLVKTGKSMTSAAIADALGRERLAVRQMVHRMAAAGTLMAQDGGYVRSGQG